MRQKRQHELFNANLYLKTEKICYLLLLSIFNLILLKNIKKNI